MASGLFFMHAGVAFSPKSMQYMQLYTSGIVFGFVGLGFMVSVCCAGIQCSWAKFVYYNKLLWGGVCIFIFLALLMTPTGKVAVRSAMFGVAVMGVWIYFLVDNGYKAMTAAFELSGGLKKQKVESFLCMLDVFGFSAESRDKISKALKMTKDTAKAMYKGYKEKSAAIMFDAVKNAGQMSTAYENAFDSIAEILKDTEYGDKIEKYVLRHLPISKNLKL
eukprot:UN27861